MGFLAAAAPMIMSAAGSMMSSKGGGGQATPAHQYGSSGGVMHDLGAGAAPAASSGGEAPKEPQKQNKLGDFIASMPNHMPAQQLNSPSLLPGQSPALQDVFNKKPGIPTSSTDFGGIA